MSSFDDIMKTIGKFKIYIFIFFMIITGIVMLYLSFQSFTFDDSKLNLYKANIIDVSCREQINNSNRQSKISFGCNLTLEFDTFDNKKITKKYHKDSNIKYEKGDQIDIYYNHNNEEILESNPKKSRYIFIIISIICFILGGLTYYYRKNESLRYFFGLDTLFNR